LTSREDEVVKLIAEGHSSKEIARTRGPRLAREPHTCQTEPQVHDVEQDGHLKDAEQQRSEEWPARDIAPEVRRDVWAEPQDPRAE
jgi:hypothetical protein